LIFTLPLLHDLLELKFLLAKPIPELVGRSFTLCRNMFNEVVLDISQDWPTVTLIHETGLRSGAAKLHTKILTQGQSVIDFHLIVRTKSVIPEAYSEGMYVVVCKNNN
jgi:hypothetical protein